MDDERRRAVDRLEAELERARARVAELERRLGPDTAEPLVNDVFERHVDMTLYIDALNGDVLWGNRAACEFYGYEREALMRLHLSDLDVMGREESLIAVHQVRRRVRSRFVFTHRLSGGEMRDVEFYGVPMVIDGREMVCAFIRDLTGLTDVQTLVEKSAALQDAVLTSMHMAPFSCRYHEGFEPQYFGASVASVTGFSPEVFYADPDFWPSRIHADDRDKVMGRFGRLETTLSTRVEFRWRVADDRYRWFELTMRLMPCENPEDGEGVCIAGLFWDVTDRKRMEKALLEREERYRTVADFTYDWEFWLGPDGRFWYVSPSFKRMTGYSPEALKADPDLLFGTIVHPQDRAWVRERLMEGLRSSEPLNFDFRIVTRESEVRWIGHVSQAAYDEDGEPVGRRASNRDVTELKATVQALRDKNQFINSIMENSPAAIHAKDVDGRYLFANARFLRKWNLQAHEIMGKTDFALLDVETAQRFAESDRAVVESGEPRLEEIEVERDGTVQHWTTSKFPLITADGAVLGVCAMSLDVTQWRETEASLRRLTQAVEQSPVSIAMTDTDGRIRSVNPHFCAASGYCEGEALGQGLGFLLDEPDEDFYEPVWDRVRRGENWHGEVRNRTKAGEVLWERVTVSPVRDRRGRLVNFVAVMDDITERKRLERLERDVERIVRHDIKSPIMSFVWVPRILRKADNLDEEQRKLLDDLESAAHRLLGMINLSRDIFKMEEGTYAFEPEDVDVLGVVRNALVDQRSRIESAGVSVEVTVDGRPPEEGERLLARGEELLCHSMASNLIQNAVEASRRGDRIVVDCGSDGGTVLSVHNDAPVPDEVAEVFFDKYATHGKKFGTGLGTYSARLMALTQGGRIEMTTSKATGTTVTVTLPAVHAHNGIDR